MGAPAAHEFKEKPRENPSLPFPKDRGREISREEAEELAKEGNRLLKAAHTSVQFSIDEASQRLIIRVVDTATGELIRQYPPEEMLAVSARLKEIVDKRARADQVSGLFVNNKQ